MYKKPSLTFLADQLLQLSRLFRTKWWSMRHELVFFKKVSCTHVDLIGKQKNSETYKFFNQHVLNFMIDTAFKLSKVLLFLIYIKYSTLTITRTQIDYSFFPIFKVGVLPTDDSKVVMKGRLGPGMMISVDLTSGQVRSM